MKLKRTERHIIKRNHIHFNEIDELCSKSKSLYNYANYLIRQEFIFNKKYFNYNKVEKLVKNHETYKSLPAQTSQQILRVLHQNWKSFFVSIKDWSKNKSKYLGRPRLPKYKSKKNGRNVVIYANQTISKKFLKENIIKPLKSGIQIKTKQQNIQQVRLVPQTNCYVVEVIYEKEIKPNENLKEENFLSIDLGVNNFATCFNNQGLRPFIINGGIVKSINQFYNKEKARLMSFVEGKSKTSKRIRKLTFKRNNKINDFIHKSSRRIVDYCVENNIKNVIIGYNQEWKQNVNRGRRNNQNFVCIPFLKFIQQVQYKGEEIGVNVILTEESYTSKCDHFAFEPMGHQKKYLGERIKRGLFISSTGKNLNADVNGSIGIFRKVIGDEVLKETLINRGTVFVPFKINNLNESFC